MKEMDPELRMALIKGEQDELSALVQQGDFGIPDCPKCDTSMSAQRPRTVSGIIAKYDYKCPKCGTCVSANGIVT